MKNNILFYSLLLIGLIEATLLSSNTKNHIHLVSDDAFTYLINQKNDVLKELITANTPIEVIKSSSADSLLHYMALHGNVDLVEHLTKHGSNVNRQNQYGITPLHQGVFSNSLATVECLIKRGADIDIQEKQYKDSPLSLVHRPESCISDEIRIYVKEQSMLKKSTPLAIITPPAPAKLFSQASSPNTITAASPDTPLRQNITTQESPQSQSIRKTSTEVLCATYHRFFNNQK